MRVKSIPQTQVLLVCMGSDCKKCGSKQLCQDLRCGLKAAGQGQDVRVQKVRCLGCCGKAPNILSFPDGKLYSDVSAKDIGTIIKTGK